MYIQVSSGVGNEEDTLRCRRVSSASCSEVEVELVPPEAASAHAHLTDISLSCLSLLISLSPDLTGLLTGDAMLDPDRWEILLSLSFSSPTLEEEQTGLMSYGTLIALANTCVRSLTRDRSPSPARSSTGRSKPSMDYPGKLYKIGRKLIFFSGVYNPPFPSAPRRVWFLMICGGNDKLNIKIQLFYSF